MAQLKIVGVMGGENHRGSKLQLSSLGTWLATLPVHLLTGGGGGVVEEVARAFYDSPDRTGKILGVLRPEASTLAAIKRREHRDYVEIPIFTHLPLSGGEGMSDLSRNHINVLSSDVLIFLPGKAGTLSEAKLAVKYGRPAIAYLGSPGDIDGLPAAIPDTNALTEIERFVAGRL